jgi:hypothetical protein
MCIYVYICKREREPSGAGRVIGVNMSEEHYMHVYENSMMKHKVVSKEVRGIRE